MILVWQQVEQSCDQIYIVCVCLPPAALAGSVEIIKSLESHNLMASSMLLLAVSLLLLALLVFIKPKRSTTTRKLNLPPGPPPLPLIGNLHQLGQMPNVSLHKLAQRYGPILHLTLGRIPTVVVSSSRLAREVLRTHDLQLASRPRVYAAKYLCYGYTDISFAPYGAYWRGVRKLCILKMLNAKRVESYAAHREAEVARMVRRITESAHPRTVNVTRTLVAYANGVLLRAAFGKDFMEGGDSERHGFHEMLYDCQVLLGGFFMVDFYPSLECISSFTGTKRVLERTWRRFDRFFDEVIGDHLERRRKKIGQEEDNSSTTKDLVDVLLDVQQNSSGDGEMPLTMDNVKAILLDMFAAGSDTSAVTLDWAMTELILNPKIMEKVQYEVRNVVGNRNIIYDSDLSRMYYLQSIVKETLRLHPPVPLIPREAREDAIIDGYNIPATTRIFINTWAIGREAESWENPTTFQPERFLQSSVDYKGQDFEFIPFGSGRRMCPGISFSMIGVQVALAQLLHSFDWELPPGTKASGLDLTEVFGLTTHKNEELVLVAKPRHI